MWAQRPEGVGFSRASGSLLPSCLISFSFSAPALAQVPTSAPRGARGHPQQRLLWVAALPASLSPSAPRSIPLSGAFFWDPPGAFSGSAAASQRRLCSAHAAGQQTPAGDRRETKKRDGEARRREPRAGGTQPASGGAAWGMLAEPLGRGDLRLREPDEAQGHAPPTPEKKNEEPGNLKDLGERGHVKRLCFDLERPYTQRAKLRVRAQMREALGVGPESTDQSLSSLSSSSSRPEEGEEGRTQLSQREAERELWRRLQAYLARLPRSRTASSTPRPSGLPSTSSVSRGDLSAASSFSPPPPQLGLPQFLRLVAFLSRQKPLLARASAAFLVESVEAHPLLHLFAWSLHREKRRLPPPDLAACVDFLLSLSERTQGEAGAQRVSASPSAPPASRRTWPLLQSVADLLLSPAVCASLLHSQVEATLALLMRVCRHPARLLGSPPHTAQNLWEQICLFLLSSRGPGVAEAELLCLLRCLSLLAEASVPSHEALAQRSPSESPCLAGRLTEGVTASVDLDTALLSRALERHLLPDWLYSASPHALTVLLLLLTRLGCLESHVFLEIAEALLLAVPFISDASLLPLLHTLLVCRQHFDLRLAQRPQPRLEALRIADLQTGGALDPEDERDRRARWSEAGEDLPAEAARHPLYEPRAKRLLQALRYRVQCRFGQVPFSVSVAELGALFSVYKPNEQLKRDFLGRCAASPDLLMHLSPELFLTAARVLARLGVSHGSQARFALAHALPRQLPRLQPHEFLELTREGAGGGVGTLESVRAAVSAEKKARLAILQVYRCLAFDACRAVLLVEGAGQSDGALTEGTNEGRKQQLLLGGSGKDSPPDPSSAASLQSSLSLAGARLPSPTSLLSLIRGWMALGLSRKAESPVPLVLCLLALEGTEKRVVLSRKTAESLDSSPAPAHRAAERSEPGEPAVWVGGCTPGGHLSAGAATASLFSSSDFLVPPASPLSSVEASSCVESQLEANRPLAPQLAPLPTVLVFPRKISSSLFHHLSMPQLLLLVCASRRSGLLLSPSLAAAILHRLRRSGGLISADGAAEIAFTLALQQLLRSPSGERMSPRAREGALIESRTSGDRGGEAGRESKGGIGTTAGHLSVAESGTWGVGENEDFEREERPSVYRALFNSVCTTLWEERVAQPTTDELVKIFWAIVAGERWTWVKRLGAPIVEFCASHFADLQERPGSQRLFFQALSHIRTKLPDLARDFFLLLHRTPALPSRFPSAAASPVSWPPSAPLSSLSSLSSPLPLTSRSMSPGSSSEQPAAAVGAFQSRNARDADEVSVLGKANAPEKIWWLSRTAEAGDACAEFDLAGVQLHTEEGIVKTTLRGSVLSELQLTWRAGQKRTTLSTVEDDLGSVLRRLAAAPFFQQTLDITPHFQRSSSARPVLRRSRESLVLPATPFSSLALVAALPSGGFLPNSPEDEEYSLTWANPVWKIGVLLLPAAGAGGASAATCRSPLRVLLEEKQRMCGAQKETRKGGTTRGKMKEQPFRDAERLNVEGENAVLDGLIKRERGALPGAGDKQTDGLRLTAKAAMHIKFLQDVRDWRVIVLQQEKVKERLKRENGERLERRLAQCRGLFPLSPPLSSFLRAYASASSLTSASSSASDVSVSSLGTRSLPRSRRPAKLDAAEIGSPPPFASSSPLSDAVLPSAHAAGGSEAETESVVRRRELDDGDGGLCLADSGAEHGDAAPPMEAHRGIIRGRKRAQLFWSCERNGETGRGPREREQRAEEERLKQVSHYRAIREAAFLQLQRELHFLFSLED
ncbi:conserved hypothetical protein [Neospora caninum Liverpool]|uniref:RAP domain-containing protein n=1 Tax=Neospora caninum (strain Liverpool) TaxID=572307 RepID=F0VLX5_NEOCL|nr:conserved hypothetical protein [Neospora caninum Liverpool]CBZ54253.1 conserved hypothetical protein [Neospora caninum Liverpool]CEL68957.1 TPA: hypothetical protein BN1204_046850 [Neospora caninum Liverpool]|eukprot:XP_003884284.1 conserved hypothetical protein [Neospora caninum Liverpool]